MAEANKYPETEISTDTPLNPLVSLTRDVVANLSDEELADLNSHITTTNASQVSLRNKAWFPKVSVLIRGVGQEIPMLAVEEIRLKAAERLNM